MFFKQIQRHSDNFSYIIADESSREAAVVDSSYNADELVKIIKNEKFQLKYVINTHGLRPHSRQHGTSVYFGAKPVAHKLSKIR
jgi:hypothetical protein